MSTHLDCVATTGGKASTETYQLPVKPRVRIVPAGMRIIFGVPKETKPFVATGIPYDRVRLRFRNNSFGWAYLKTKDGIRQFCVVDAGNHFTIDPATEQGRNTRP